MNPILRVVKSALRDAYVVRICDQDAQLFEVKTGEGEVRGANEERSGCRARQCDLADVASANVNGVIGISWDVFEVERLQVVGAIFEDELGVRLQIAQCLL